MEISGKFPEISILFPFHFHLPEKNSKNNQKIGKKNAKRTKF